MKRKYLLIAGFLLLALATAGCGKKESEEEGADAQVTVAPVSDTSTTKEKELVNMEKATDEETFENVMGTKTSTASQLIIYNKTGAEVSALYIRPNTDDDDEWGDDLIDGAFKLKNGDKAVYYYEKGSTTLYDIRITYTDEDRSECFFRKLPMTTMSQISLCMEGTGEDAIPYARYMVGTSKSEKSTLEEVKKRLGLSDDDEDDDKDEDSSDTDTQPTSAPQATTEPDEDEDYTPPEEVTNAENYIGQSIGELIEAVGEPPEGSDYQEEPESGTTGYYYYDGYTVYTSVDENGNEVVAGVW